MRIDIRKAKIIRYLTPLREGGSLPAIVEADDGFKYVVKFRGAGQGKKALIAELIGGELARAMNLRVPELVFLDLDERFPITEPDEEIQDLLKFSVGLNLGLHFLSGAITYDMHASQADPLEASKVVLLDSIITNVDRTPKNPNLLIWNRELWLIDHGACLYFHHSWTKWEEHSLRKFPLIKNHVLLSKASKLSQAEEIISNSIKTSTILEIVNSIPEEWLIEDSNEILPEEKRSIYATYLTNRIQNITLLTKEANEARNGNI